MGILYSVARTILQEHKHRPISGKVLLIGRQKVHFTPEQMLDVMEREGVQRRPGVEFELDMTTLNASGRRLITDRCFFSLFSESETLALDISPYEGAEIICDLNQPTPEHLHGQFDFIFNGSCLDNLFDPASALKNMSRLLAPGGRILHIEHGSPIQSAYLMYSPAWFFDYYAINNFADCRVLACLFDNISDPWNAYEWLAYSEGAISNHQTTQWQNIVSIVMAEKAGESSNDLSPVQAFYRMSHDTEDPLYQNAFARFQKSGRQFCFDQLSEPHPDISPAFRYVGVIDPPAQQKSRAALQALEKGRAARNNGMMAEAFDHFSAAIALDASVGHPGLMFMERGDILRALGDFEAARADYATALGVLPDQREYQLRMSEISEGRDGS